MKNHLVITSLSVFLGCGPYDPYTAEDRAPEPTPTNLTSFAEHISKKPFWLKRMFPNSTAGLFSKATNTATGALVGVGLVCNLTHKTEESDEACIARLALPNMSGDVPQEELSASMLFYPLASLQIGDPINIEFSEMDIGVIYVRGIQHLGALTISYQENTPIKGSFKKQKLDVDVECRVLPRASLEEAMKVTLIEANYALRRLKTKLAAKEATSYDYDEVKESLFEMSLLVGWADPRVASRVGVFEALPPAP